MRCHLLPEREWLAPQAKFAVQERELSVDGATQPEITAGKVTGRWQDKINSLDGTISGTVTPDGFHILLSGQFFDAKMTVVSSPCQQSVTIVPEQGTPIKKLSAVLKKC
jgi:hypothetical protein